jgi:tRNA(Ile)-lysidine synthase
VGGPHGAASPGPEVTAGPARAHRGRTTDAEALLELCTFPPPGSELSCAVSGGADSLALLVLAVRAGCRVTAVNVDHGLREDSHLEAEVVAEVAGRYGASFRVERVDVAEGPNLEARAREARRAVLPLSCATGHTMDDQAETVLLNLLRGAGSDGLRAMREGYEHPLLGVRRADTGALCRHEGLTPVEDPANAEGRFARNRVRHDLLPLCCEIAGRDVVPILARQASVIGAECDLLEELSAALDPTDAKGLAAAPKPLAMRAARRWLKNDGHPPGLRAVERVLEVASGKVRATDLAPRTRVRRSRGVLYANEIQDLPLGPRTGASRGVGPASTSATTDTDARRSR